MSEDALNDKSNEVHEKVLNLFSEAATLPDGSKGATLQSRREAASRVGYEVADFEKAPDEALLGIGCGNPVALASLKEGQTVLDLGSGCGFDVFLAAKEVGPLGRAIGVDMNPLMLERARTSAAQRGYRNVEFRYGRIEELPVEDGNIDVVISNCVINLSPEKERVYAEIMRVLTPGGTLFVSDLITSQRMPEWFLGVVSDVLGFRHWLLDRAAYLNLLKEPGFTDIEILAEMSGGFLLSCKDPACDSIFNAIPEAHRRQIPDLAASIVSIKLTARKPIRS